MSANTPRTPTLKQTLNPIACSNLDRCKTDKAVLKKIKGYRCPKCFNRELWYCSDACRKAHWTATHAAQCKGKSVNSLEGHSIQISQEEARKIEQTSPFLKKGLLLTADQIKEEKMFASIKLSDLKIEKESIGRGAYG